ncbi:MAG: thioredoxin family protein [Bacteroidales bacterium]
MDYQDIHSIENLRHITENQPAVLVYFSHHNCNVCKVLKPKVRELIENNFSGIALYYVNTLKQPEAAGQYSVFAVPTILVFFEGKEYVRESRYVNMDKFYGRLNKLYGTFFG